jgi:hypothetical protein
MGLPDAYPFVITERIADKLAFIQDICVNATLDASPQPRVGDAATRASRTTVH